MSQKLTLSEQTTDQAARIEHIKLPDPRDKGKLAFTCKKLLTNDECAHLVKLSETEMGYSKLSSFYMEKLGRDNWRAERVSPAFAQTVFERIQEHLPEYWYQTRRNGEQTKWKMVGLNECFRFYRYDPGNVFPPHKDGVFRRTNKSYRNEIRKGKNPEPLNKNLQDRNGERSFITFIVFLNEGFEGGATTFYNAGIKDPVPCIPETGKALIFQHDILHEGSELLKGQKYAFRTDVMYAQVQKGSKGKEFIPKTYAEKPLPVDEENGGIWLDDRGLKTTENRKEFGETREQSGDQCDRLKGSTENQSTVGNVRMKSKPKPVELDVSLDDE